MMKKLIKYDEDINCMTTIGTNFSPTFTVIVNPDSRRIGDPYLKICDGKRFHSSEHTARLNLKEPALVKHHSDGKKEWNLTNKDIKNLKNYLNSKSKKNPKYTNWEYTIFSWNDEYGFLESYEGVEPLIDEFFNGYFDTEENLSNPSYVPSYQLMPDWKV